EGPGFVRLLRIGRQGRDLVVVPDGPHDDPFLVRLTLGKPPQVVVESADTRASPARLRTIRHPGRWPDDPFRPPSLTPRGQLEQHPVHASSKLAVLRE